MLVYRHGIQVVQGVEQEMRTHLFFQVLQFAGQVGMGKGSNFPFTVYPQFQHAKSDAYRSERDEFDTKDDGFDDKFPAAE